MSAKLKSSYELSCDGRGMGFGQRRQSIAGNQTHERECALRYERIEERLKDGSKRFDRLDEKIDRFGNRLWWIIGLIVVSILVPQFLGG
jgi:hypothetical protein